MASGTLPQPGAEANASAETKTTSAQPSHIHILMIPPFDEPQLRYLHPRRAGVVGFIGPAVTVLDILTKLSTVRESKGYGPRPSRQGRH